MDQAATSTGRSADASLGFGIVVIVGRRTATSPARASGANTDEELAATFVAEMVRTKLAFVETR
jgi:hypothetical protein